MWPSLVEMKQDVFRITNWKRSWVKGDWWVTEQRLRFSCWWLIERHFYFPTSCKRLSFTNPFTSFLSYKCCINTVPSACGFQTCKILQTKFVEPILARSYWQHIDRWLQKQIQGQERVSFYFLKYTVVSPHNCTSFKLQRATQNFS